jgi:hypothetical protein
VAFSLSMRRTGARGRRLGETVHAAANERRAAAAYLQRTEGGGQRKTRKEDEVWASRFVFRTGRGGPLLYPTFSPDWCHQSGLKGLFLQLVPPTGTKGPIFSPGWCYQSGLKTIFCHRYNSRAKRPLVLLVEPTASKDVFWGFLF